MTQEEKYQKMTGDSVPGLICSLAIPTIISMMVTSIYNMADTFFVGKISTEATAAVGVVFSIMALIQATGFFFGHGSGNYISRKLGSKELDDAVIMATTAFVNSFLFGCLISVFCLTNLDTVASLLGATATIMEDTKAYLRIILIGAPFITSSFTMNNQLRFQGNASYAMIGIVSGGIINIILDPFLIFALGMGVSGAALATTLSQVISFCILLVMIIKSGSIRYSIKNYKPNWYNIKEVFRGGFPSLCRQGLASIAVILLNRAAGGYSDAVIAAMSIVNRLTMFANSALIGFGQGFQPVCGFNYGAGLYKRVRQGFWFCVKYAFIFLTVISIVCYIFAPEIVQFFRKGDPEVIKTGAEAFRYQCIVFPLSAWIVMNNMMLQSIGKAFKASVVAAARQGIFFIPLILILPSIFGVFGVIVCQTVSDILSFLLSVPIGISVLKEMRENKTIKDSDSQ